MSPSRAEVTDMTRRLDTILKSRPVQDERATSNVSAIQMLRSKVLDASLEKLKRADEGKYATLRQRIDQLDAVMLKRETPPASPTTSGLSGRFFPHPQSPTTVMAALNKSGRTGQHPLQYKWYLSCIDLGGADGAGTFGIIDAASSPGIRAATLRTIST